MKCGEQIMGSLAPHDTSVYSFICVYILAMVKEEAVNLGRVGGKRGRNDTIKVTHLYFLVNLKELFKAHFLLQVKS